MNPLPCKYGATMLLRSLRRSLERLDDRVPATSDVGCLEKADHRAPVRRAAAGGEGRKSQGQASRGHDP